MSVMLRIAKDSCRGEPGQVSTCTGECERDEEGEVFSAGGGGEGLEITYGENLWAWLRRLEKRENDRTTSRMR